MLIAVLPFICFADEPKQEAKQEQKQEEDKVTGEIDLSVMSAYIRRGYEQTRDSVVVQPAASYVFPL